MSPGRQTVRSPDKWDVAQEMILTGVDDTERDGDQAYAIELIASSNDSVYDVLDPEDVFVTNKDDEKGGGPKK